MSTEQEYKPPFPWFGGKSQVAAAVWERLGDVNAYVEPFFGSGAVLMMRPERHRNGLSTVNDLDGMVCNFWRAVAADPDGVAQWGDWPVIENDLHARHVWLMGQKASLRERLEGDPDWYDVKVAGWWCWGMCCWIGGEFCNTNGPWRVVDGKLVKGEGDGDAGQGISRQLPHLINAGQGISRQRPHLGDAGQGIHRKRPHLGDAGQGIHRSIEGSVQDYMRDLQRRLRNVRVCCGDWARVVTDGALSYGRIKGVFLDPPYSAEAGRSKVYSVEDLSVAHAVRAWCVERTGNPELRIALCGYEGEHDELEGLGWSVLKWKAGGGYSSFAKSDDHQSRDNAHRERIWFSPTCLGPVRRGLGL